MSSTAEATATAYCNFSLEERFTCLMCTDKVVFDWIDLQRHCENVHFWYHNKKSPFFPKLVMAGLVSFIERRRCFTCKRCNHGIIVDFDVDENARILRQHEQECRDSTVDEERTIDAALEALKRVSMARRPIPMPPPPPKIAALKFPRLDEVNEPGPSSSMSLPYNPIRQYSSVTSMPEQETILGANDGKKQAVDFPGFTVEEVKSVPPPSKRRKTEHRPCSSVVIKPTPRSFVDSSRAASTQPLVSLYPVIREGEVTDFSDAGSRPKRTSLIPPKYSEETSGYPDQTARNTTKLNLEAPVSVEVEARLQNSSFRNGNKPCHGITNSRGKKCEDRRSSLEVKKLMTKILDFTVKYKNKRGRQLSSDFHQLPSRKELPEYYERIEKPLDLKKLKANINNSKYSSVDELETDFMLLCKNAQTYNRKKSSFYVDSVVLQSVFAEARRQFEAEAASKE